MFKNNVTGLKRIDCDEIRTSTIETETINGLDINTEITNLQNQITDISNENSESNNIVVTTNNINVTTPNKILSTNPFVFQIPTTTDFGTITFKIPLSLKKTYKNADTLTGKTVNNSFIDTLSSVSFRVEYEDTQGDWIFFDSDETTSDETMPKQIYVNCNSDYINTRTYEVFVCNVSGSFKFETRPPDSFQTAGYVNCRIYLDCVNSKTDTSEYTINTSEYFINTDITTATNVPEIFSTNPSLIEAQASYPDDSNPQGVTNRLVYDATINPNSSKFSILLKFSTKRDLATTGTFHPYDIIISSGVFSYDVNNDGTGNFNIPVNGRYTTDGLLNFIKSYAKNINGHTFTSTRSNGGTITITLNNPTQQWSIKTITTEDVRKLLGFTSLPLDSINRTITGSLITTIPNETFFGVQTYVKAGLYKYENNIESRLSFREITFSPYTWIWFPSENDSQNNWVYNTRSLQLLHDTTKTISLTSSQFVYNRDGNSNHIINIPDGDYTSITLINYILDNKNPDHNLMFDVSQDGIITSSWDNHDFRIKENTTTEVALLLGISTLPARGETGNIIGDLCVLDNHAEQRIYRVKIEEITNTQIGNLFVNNFEQLDIINNSYTTCNAFLIEDENYIYNTYWHVKNIDTEFIDNKQYGSNYSLALLTSTNDGFTSLDSLNIFDKLIVNDIEVQNIKAITLTNEDDQNINDMVQNNTFRPMSTYVINHEATFILKYGRDTNSLPYKYLNEINGSWSSNIFPIDSASGKIHIEITKETGYDYLQNGAKISFLNLDHSHPVYFKFSETLKTLSNTHAPNDPIKITGNLIEFVFYSPNWYLIMGDHIRPDNDAEKPNSHGGQHYDPPIIIDYL